MNVSKPVTLKASHPVIGKLEAVAQYFNKHWIKVCLIVWGVEVAAMGLYFIGATGVSVYRDFRRKGERFVAEARRVLDEYQRAVNVFWERHDARMARYITDAVPTLSAAAQRSVAINKELKERGLDIDVDGAAHALEVLNVQRENLEEQWRQFLQIRAEGRSLDVPRVALKAAFDRYMEEFDVFIRQTSIRTVVGVAAMQAGAVTGQVYQNPEAAALMARIRQLMRDLAEDQQLDIAERTELDVARGRARAELDESYRELNAPV